MPSAALAAAASSGSNPPVEDTARRNAEECLCLLSVLESLLRHLGAVEQDTMKQLMADLLALISKQRYLQVTGMGTHAPPVLQPASAAPHSFNGMRGCRSCFPLFLGLVPPLASLMSVILLQVVAAGCQVLCTLAPLYPPVSSSISQLVTKCYNIAEGALRQQQGPTVASPALVQNAPK